MNKKIFKTIKILLIILILYFSFSWLTSVLSLDRFQGFAEKLGIFGHVLIVFYTAFSQILAPLAGTPAVVLSVLMFGVYKTVLYLYIASMISAIANFYISRKFGRKLVLKFVGKKAISQVDKFTEIFGTKLLITSRIMEFSVFELISYAAGLTKISFKKYFVITVIFTLIPSIVLGFIFKDIDVSSKNNVFLWFGTILLTGIIFSVFVKIFIKRKNKHSCLTNPKNNIV